MQKEFDAPFKRLNAAQKQAVEAIDGPVLVVAGPGTGKTQLLSLRVANILLKTDTDPSNILCLTFTNKAAVNMRERLYELVGPLSTGVVVRTFHSLASDIMNQYPDYFWNGARLSVAPDAIQTEIIQEILSSLPLNNPLSSTFAGAYTALNDIKQALKVSKEAGQTPEELKRTINANLKYIDKIEPKLVDLLTPTLNIKRLAGLKESITRLPPQKTDQNLLLPLDTVLIESLSLAIEQDMQAGKTKNTGKWKAKWLQTVDGKKGLFNERKRNEWWAAVSDVYKLYRERLHRRGFYDFSDMMIEVIEQIQNQPDMRADIQERFPYVLIDEFQDTNAAQLRLAHLIADHYSSNNRPNLMAVGDDDQSIFAFNGAELNNMLGFKRSYPDTKLIVLSENYRSTEAVLNSAAQIIEQAEDRLVKREPGIEKILNSTAQTKKSGKPSQISYPSRQHQQTALAKKIKELWDSGEKDIAVLARKHQSLEQLANILLQNGVPIRYERRNNILDHPAVLSACLIAEVAVSISAGNKANVNAKLSELLRHPMWEIPPKTLWKLAVSNYSSPDWLESMLSHDNKQLSQIGGWLVWLARSSADQSLPIIMEYILGLQEGQYLISPFRDYYLANRKINDDYLQTLSAISRLRDLTSEFSERSASLTDFVRFLELNRSTGSVIADESWFVSGEQAVQLLTVYKAKGLEFDHVFVVDAIDSMWRPRVGGRASPANLQLQSYGERYDDYIRLLYVAITRARYSFVATSFFTDDKGEEILPTPLLSTLPLTKINKPIEDPIEVLENALRWPRLDTEDEKFLLSERLDNFSLSQTALIDFLNVAEAGPKSFLERHLLHIPRPRSPVGSYGTAIHAALETAQRLVNTSKLNIDTVLDRFESALAQEHMTPLDFELFKNRGLELLPKLLGKGGIKLSKGSLAEQRIDNIILGEARIGGKLDSIDPAGKALIISDYKTGKALHSFDTKNQSMLVKSWRHRTQLLFYMLLVNNSSRFKSKKTTSAQMIYVEAENASQRFLAISQDQASLKRLEDLINAVWQHVIKLEFPDTGQYAKDYSGIKIFEEDLLKGNI